MEKLFLFCTFFSPCTQATYHNNIIALFLRLNTGISSSFSHIDTLMLALHLCSVAHSFARPTNLVLKHQISVYQCEHSMYKFRLYNRGTELTHNELSHQ